MASKLVHNPTIGEAQLLRPKPLLSRPYVWPFLIIYPIAYNIYLNHYDTYIVGREWTFVYTLTLLSVHALIWLLPQWNLDIKTKFQFEKLSDSDLDSATHILAKAAPNCGLSEICEINRDIDDHKELLISFSYQKRRHLWDDKAGFFSPPKFIVDSKPVLKTFLSSKGLNSKTDDFSKLLRLYGQNKFDIPIPTFLELFKEHALAPFFVFQLFSIALWCMDEMWYLSLFSLFMLVSFECTTVWQRRSTMTEFQSMGIKPYDIYVYRNNSWTKMLTTDLLPGDLVSITRTNDDKAIPCDLVLVDGSCIMNEAMLSGESTPLLKESIKLRPAEDHFDPEGLDKNSILHGGTTCLQVTSPTEPIIKLAPDNGAFAIVTKTGFETSQGSLVRVMIFSSERMSVANKEAFFFILFLLVFAIIASWYVWVEGTKMGRIQSKLILDCIIVITSVVPPELPMELTMAVNSSLAALGKHYIYCTEPFRIAVAGRIDVCCFDKTGTLTGEDLVFEGLAGFNKDDIRALSKPSEVPSVTVDVLGAAHALVKLDDGEVVGDPMEKATLKASGWKLSNKKDTVESVSDSKKKIRILRRFQFSSALKRSSAIADVNGKTLVAVKGAPETIRDMITDGSDDFEKVYKSFTRSGSRVLGLAYKYLEDNINHQRVTHISREQVESGLKFAGFIVFHCPMKEDAIETITMLNESSHRCVMITGDNPLTAVHVAREVGIVKRETLILDSPEKHHNEESELVWRNVEETKIIPFNSGDSIDESLFARNDICVTGYALGKLMNHPQLMRLLRHSWIYARVSPSQKEFILNSYKEMGYNTLMCGDGTNDVGALKQAHIGVALLNGTEESLKQIVENRKIEAQKKVYEKQCELMARWQQPSPKVPKLIAHLYPPGPLNPFYLEAMEKHGLQVTDEMRKAVEVANRTGSAKSHQANSSGSAIASQLMGSLEEAEDENEAPTLKLGDASVAAPFTSKLANVSAVTHIIRQGRCALVSTIQMYKILALNCLISAYSLSVLYLAGIKFGDAQATVSGLLLSVCFFSISRGRSLDKLSVQRPQPGIFNIYIMGSIMGQFIVHLAALIYITRETYIREPREPQVDLEKEFKPSLLNTAMFLIQLSQQVATFVINYQGPPFRESIKDNKGMYYGLLGVTFLAFSGATEFMPELNEAIQFVPMTTDFKTKLTVTMILDLVLSYGIEAVLKHFFSDFKASDIADHSQDEVVEIVEEKN